MSGCRVQDEVKVIVKKGSCLIRVHTRGYWREMCSQGILEGLAGKHDRIRRQGAGSKTSIILVLVTLWVHVRAYGRGLYSQDMLEGVAGQHERMKEMVAAVVDSESGKGASLSALLAEHADRAASRPTKEEYDRLRAEVRQPPLYSPRYTDAASEGIAGSENCYAASIIPVLVVNLCLSRRRLCMLFALLNHVTHRVYDDVQSWFDSTALEICNSFR